MHGSHQVAQKSTTSDFAFEIGGFGFPPATFSSSKSGAGPFASSVRGNRVCSAAMRNRQCKCQYDGEACFLHSF